MGESLPDCARGTGETGKGFVMSPEQLSDFNRLRAYYPYRMFFLVDDPRTPEKGPTVWAMRDRREINRVLREGGTVSEIKWV